MLEEFDTHTQEDCVLTGTRITLYNGSRWTLELFGQVHSAKTVIPWDFPHCHLVCFFVGNVNI